jgi:hypothetical protein
LFHYGATVRLRYNFLRANAALVIAQNCAMLIALIQGIVCAFHKYFAPLDQGSR